MITYDAAQRIVVMDEQDLEQCGFRSEWYAAALQACGLADWRDDGPRWPVALIVNYGGALDRARTDVPPQVAWRRSRDLEAFNRLLAILGLSNETRREKTR